MATPPLVNPLPMEIAPALADRRLAIARRTVGRVLDLGGWSDHLVGYRLGAEVESLTMLDDLEDLPGLDGGPFDSIVSLIRTPLVADIDQFFETVLGRCADGGHIHLVEPSGRSGRLGCLRAGGGLHLDRDLPADLRSRGLVVTDLTRFEVPSLSAPMRPFIDAIARRPTTTRCSSPS